MSKRGAVVELVGNYEDNQAVPEELGQAFAALEDAHSAFVQADTLHGDEVADLGRQIQELTAERQRLIQERKDARHASRESIAQADQTIEDFMADPKSAIHPVLAAVILAPRIGGGSLKNLDTFNGIKGLAHDLYDLHQYQQEQESPQPVVLFSKRFDHKRQKMLGQMSFGKTIPGEGLTPNMGQRITAWHSSGLTEYGPQPMLSLSVDNETAGAASPSPDNSHYVYNNGKVRGVNNRGKSGPKDLSKHDYIPEVSGFDLPLPVGNFDTPNTIRPFVYYDRDDGVEVVEMPHIIGVGNNTVCAIGEQAIMHLFTDLQHLNNGKNSEQRRVLRNLSLTVAHQGLGLAIKRQELRQRLGRS